MNAKMRLSNRFWTGIQVLSIFQEQFTGGVTENKNFLLYGLSTQFDCYSRQDGRGYLELSVNKSNMLNTFNNYHSQTQKKVYIT